MEAVVALGIASNIVQLIEVGAKLVSKSYHIYKYGDGAHAEIITQATVASDLSKLSAELRTSLRDVAPVGPLSPADQSLDDIGSKCVEVADEICARLEELRVPSGASKLKSVQLALKSLRSRSKRAEFDQRLQTLREEFHARVSFDIRYVIDLHLANRIVSTNTVSPDKR